MIKSAIKQEIIDNLAGIEIAGMYAEENEYINAWIRYTLQYAKNYNDSNEVGIMLDRANWGSYDIVSGTEHYVKYNTKTMRKWIEAGNDNLILLHNHPNNQIFSDRDIFNFCKTKAVNTMIVAGNKGNIYFLQKQEDFDKFKLIECYSKATEKYMHICPREKILENVLQRYQQALNIQYIEEKV